jgi:hypothetical protein
VIITQKKLLKFGYANSKLEGQAIATFGLPAGRTCPGARTCHAFYDLKKKKLVDGPHQEVRCFAASLEALRPNVRDSNSHNLAMLQEAATTDNMARLINLSLPSRFWSAIRVHWSGDFFSEDYFLAWLSVAGCNKERMFYGYTTSVDILARYRSILPDNFRFVASRGGKFDHMIDAHGLRSSRIVFHPDEAGDLPIDHDDTLPRNLDVKHFCLLLHGQGAAGSNHNKATARLRREGIKYSYSRGKTTNPHPVP